MKNRILNIDLIKVFAMLMIIYLHTLGHGGVLNNVNLTSSQSSIVWLVESISIVAVNLYVLSSGYLMINKTVSSNKIISLYLKILFYSLFLFLVLLLLSYEKISAINLLKVFTPLLSREYWFVSVYFIMYLISPYFNRLLNSLNKKEYKVLLLFSIIVFSIIPNLFFYAGHSSTFGGGTGIVWFLILYAFGGYIMKYPPLFNKRIIFMTLFIFLVHVVFIQMLAQLNYTYKIIFFDKALQYSLGYNSITIAFYSISLFITCTCKKIMCTSRNVWVLISNLTLGVYLIHDNPYVRNAMWKSLGLPQYFDDGNFYMIFVVPIMIFVVTLAVEFIRFKIFLLFDLDNKLYKKISKIKLRS